MVKNILFILSFILFLSSFAVKTNDKTPRTLDPSQYLEWYHSKNYPYRDTVKVNDIIYSVEWVPYEVELAREVLRGKISKKEFKKRYQTEKPTDFHIRFIIQLPNSDLYNYKLGSDESNTSRTEYYSFQLKHDFTIKTANLIDSLVCQQALLERTIPTPKTRFDLFFEDKLMNQACELIFKDLIFTKKEIRFDLSSIIKNRLPQLKY